MERIAFVTGGNRGIGFEACRQLALAGERVVVASRRAGVGRAAAAELASSGLAVEPAQLDVALPESISRFAAGGGRVVNGSTGMAQLDDVDGGYAPRRVSKTAQTEMSGPHATRSVEAGAGGIVWLALQGPGGPTGGFFCDGQRLAW